MFLKPILPSNTPKSIPDEMWSGEKLYISFIVPHASVQPFGDPLEENRDLISFCST